MTLPEPSTVKDTLEWLSERGYTIPIDLKVKAIRLHLIPSREIKAADSYSSIRDGLWIAIYDSIYDYLNGDLTIYYAKQKMALAISEAYVNTTDVAYQDGGGELPIDEDTASFANGEVQAQLGFVDSLFTSLKQLKKEDDYDANAEAADHADGYTTSLDGLYNGVKMGAAGSKMLTLAGTDGKVSCSDCQKYKGQRHKASWWLSRGIFGPPFRMFECGGWECQHLFEDDDGKEFTI